MTDIAVTSLRVAPVYGSRSAEIFNHVAGEDLSAGDVLTFNADGAAVKADSNGENLNSFRGIALETVKSGMPVAVLYRGHVYGYTLTELSCNAPVYVSDTAGALADTAGATKTILAGYVVALSNKTKILYFNGFNDGFVPAAG